MDDNRKPSGIGRRDFLRKAGTGTGVAGLGMIVLAAGAEAQPAKGDDEASRGGGYRETDHVRQYYRVARF